MAFNIAQKLLPPVLYKKWFKGKKEKSRPAPRKVEKPAARRKEVSSFGTGSFLSRIIPPAFLKGKGQKSKSKPARASSKTRSPKPAASQDAPASAFGWGRLALLGLSLALAAKGQSLWLQQSQPQTIVTGWYFFGPAILLFLIALKPWKREGLKNLEMTRNTELFFLGAVFLVAAFFRIHRLGEIPPGIFFDQGFMGYAALKILHENFRPFFTDEVFRNPPLLLYQLAAWLIFFKASSFGFYLFFAFLSLVSLGLIYWTFRQLAGPRMALLALYILAVMRWHINFSRNGFPTIQVPLYMFGTTAFLLYGLRTGKRWSFYAAAVFFGLGLYTYQAYKIFPFLLVILGLYEWFTNRQAIVKNAKSLVGFSVLFFLLISPLLYQMTTSKSLGWREDNYNIISDIKEAHSLAPLKRMIFKTSRMFNREGDLNERHNYPNYRMLDDITAGLFVLGLFYALSRIVRRKYFFAAVGFLVMCLPCLLSQDPAHANRMLGTTPFIALLAAAPLAAIWGRLRGAWGAKAEIFFVLVLLEPLFLMANQNYKTYFELQASNNSLWTTEVWAGYSVPETRIGEMIKAEGEKYDYFLTPRFENYPTIQFLGYFQKDKVKKMENPADLAPFKVAAGQAACYVLLKEHGGMVSLLRELYPGGKLEEARDSKGNPIVDFYKVSAEDIQAAKGLTGTLNGKPAHFADFPKDLPAGPYHATLKGSVFIAATGDYRFESQVHGSVRMTIGGHPVAPATRLNLARGFYSIEVEINAHSGPVEANFLLVGKGGQAQILGPANLTSLKLNHGLKGSWYGKPEEKGDPALVQWNPVLNFPHGGDFTYTDYALFIHWTGTLRAPETGSYEFETRTKEYSKVVIDGKTVIDGSDRQLGRLYLTAGPHSIQVYFRKVLGPTFTLLWKTPKGFSPVEIPMGAFGETH
jgi:hypothetical protein